MNTSSSVSPKLEFPPCQHKVKGKPSCKWIHAHTGGIAANITPGWCKFVCEKTGPWCGKEITKAQEAEFLAEAFVAHFAPYRAEGKLIQRVLKHYQSEAEIQIPKVWPRIKELLTPFLDPTFVTGMYLTGSVVLKLDQHKDYDVIINVTDLDHVPDSFRDSLPTTVDGVKVDYFITSVEPLHRLFFISLDCDRRILYTSKWFDLKLKAIEPGITIVHQPDISGLLMDQVLRKKIDSWKA